MATTIVTKSGSGAPTASDLVAGELAVDLTNKRLYTEDSGGTVLEVGSNPYNFTANHDGSAKLATTASGIDVTGSVTANPTGGVVTLGANGFITSKQSLDVATAGGRFVGESNRGALGQIQIEQTTTGADGGYIKLATSASGSTSPTERVRITQEGNVGIGTMSVSYPFVVSDGGNLGFEFSPNDQNTGVNRLYSYDRGTSAYKDFKLSASEIIFGYGSSGGNEAARIDASGNLLVGRDSNSFGSDPGLVFRPNNDSYIIADDRPSITMRRNNSDGAIAQFYRDDTIVGSIGAYNSASYIQSGSAGSYTGLYCNTNKIEPVGDASGDIRADATVDLGSTANRFKDLHLSGTAYLPTVDIDSGSIVGCTEVGSAASPISSGEFNTLTVNTNLSVPGTISPNGIVFNDASALGGGRYDQAMTFGNDSDLAIYHDGLHSYITDKGTGDLKITTSAFRVRNAADTQNQIVAVQGSSVTLYHNDSVKLTTTSSGVTVTGLLTADTKSFTIDHPTKEGMKLRYGSLEGPEHGVYVRGRLNGENTIELPEVWLGLVDADTITVNLTPIGKGECWVEDIQDNTVKVGGHLNCFYMVLAERKDVDKLEVEFPADGS